MEAFPWARRPAPSRTVQLTKDAPLYVLSDVHLGDGSRSDAFVGKDRDLLDLLEKIRAEGAHLIIAGDIIDFSQAGSFTRVLRAHGDVLRQLSSMAGEGGVTYIWGNHDYDMALYRDLLRWDVCSAVEIGDDILLVHGHQLDPYIANNLRESGVATTVHHQIERFLGTWIRLPLEDFYTLAGRLVWWFAWHWTSLARVFYNTLASLGFPRKGQEYEAYLRYWIQAQLGNPMDLWPQVKRHLEQGRHRVLVCGHSHMPGKVEILPGRWFVNTGSWTFRSTQYVYWDGEDFEVRDWVRDLIIEDELYQPLIQERVQGITFDQWWRHEYRGWLRFRSAERRRRGLDSRPWYLQDSEQTTEDPPGGQGAGP